MFEPSLIDTLDSLNVHYLVRKIGLVDDDTLRN